MAVCLDTRIGGEVRYVITDNLSSLMQIPPEMRKCVAFVARKDGDKYKFLGTAFFVSRKLNETHYALYLVTAKHLFKNLLTDIDEIYIRINLKSGIAAWVSAPLQEWIYHPTDDSIDVAVIPCGIPEEWDHRSFPMTGAATEQVFADIKLGVGDEIFLIGLFHPHSGEKRNIPIVRVGNLAALPEEKVQLESPLKPIDAYLVEAKSIGGLSGSPVFIHGGSTRIISGALQIGRGTPFFLLGLMHGHWNASANSQDAIAEDVTMIEKINMGIAIVVPVEKINEVFEQPRLLEWETALCDEINRQNAPTAD